MYMNVTLEPIHKEEPIETPEPQSQAKPKLDEKDVSSVEKKRQNKIYQCDKCGKQMNRKTLLYHHNCENKPTKPIPPPREIVKEVIKEVPQEITDDHVEQYLKKKQEAYAIKAEQERLDRFNRLMRNAF